MGGKNTYTMGHRLLRLVVDKIGCNRHHARVQMWAAGHCQAGLSMKTSHWTMLQHVSSRWVCRVQARQ
jgi:hypothetical protein